MFSDLPAELVDMICAEVAGRNRNATGFGFASLKNLRLVNKTIGAVASSKMFSLCRFAMNPKADRRLKNFARTGLGLHVRTMTIRPVRRLIGDGPKEWEDELFYDWPENLTRALSAFTNITTLKLSGMRSQVQGYCILPFAVMWARALLAVSLPNLIRLKLCREFAGRFDDTLRTHHTAGLSPSLLQYTLGQVRELTLVGFGLRNWDALARSLINLRHLHFKRGCLLTEHSGTFWQELPTEKLLTLTFRMMAIGTGIFDQMLESQASSLRRLELHQWRLDEGTLEELSDSVMSHCRYLIIFRTKNMCSYVKVRGGRQISKDFVALNCLRHHINAKRQ